MASATCKPRPDGSVPSRKIKTESGNASIEPMLGVKNRRCFDEISRLHLRGLLRHGVQLHRLDGLGRDRNGLRDRERPMKRHAQSMTRHQENSIESGEEATTLLLAALLVIAGLIYWLA